MSASKWKPYPEYRVIQHAGIEKIPNHWDSKRMRYVFRERGEVSQDGTEELLSVSKYTGVRVRSTTTDREARAASLVGYKKCEPNDIVSNIMLAWDSALGVAFDSGIVSSAYEVYVPQQEIDPHFLDLLLRTPEYRVAFTIVSKGIVPSRWRMYTESFNDIQMILPPLKEQKKIGSFVHRINENISRNIENLETQISLLEEKRSALIKQTVTKGLNPDVSMKDSEIDWIGQIPLHWEVKKLKHVTECLDSVRIPLNSEQRSEVPGDIPYYGATKQVDTVADWLFDETLVLLGEDGAPFFEPLKDVAYRIDGKSWVNNHAHVLRPKGIEATFLSHALNIVSYSSYIDGSTRDKLNQSKMKEIPVPFPPNEECREIGERIQEIESNLSGIIKSTQIMIETLVEFRTALISAAVTGKIDVRGQA